MHSATPATPILPTPQPITARWEPGSLALAALLTATLLLALPLLQAPLPTSAEAPITLRALQRAPAAYLPPRPPETRTAATANPHPPLPPFPITPATLAPPLVTLAFQPAFTTPDGIPLQPLDPTAFPPASTLTTEGLLTDGQAAFDIAPIPIATLEPLYPARARLRGIEGEALIEFWVETDGQTRAPRVLRSHPPGIFDKAAIDAITRWRFQPARRGGAPVAARVHQQIQFRLETAP